VGRDFEDEVILTVHLWTGVSDVHSKTRKQFLMDTCT